MVMVTTTVVRSRNPMCRTAAACAPSINASAAVTTSTAGRSSGPAMSQPTAMTIIATALPAVTSNEEGGSRSSPVCRRVTRAPSTAPAMKETSASRLFSTGMSWTPTKPNPMNSTLPVMLPVKTSSSPTKATPSTAPVAAVSASRVPPLRHRMIARPIGGWTRC